jgi:hypothetical protein
VFGRRGEVSFDGTVFHQSEPESEAFGSQGVAQRAHNIR